MSKHFMIDIGWLTGAQVSNKFFRLAATVFIARYLVPEQYGLLAIIWTVNEVILAIIRRVTQTSIINCNAEELGQFSKQSFRINLTVVMVSALVQMILAFFMVSLYNEPTLFWYISFLALGHLFLPFAMTHAAINIRNGKFKLIALIDVSQAFVENLLTILLILVDFGVWSVLIPKVITVPIWIYFHRVNTSLPVSNNQVTTSIQLVSASSKVIVTDCIIVVRNNIDYLLISMVMGLEAVGIYFFAYNAGLGIANSIMQSNANNMLSHLSRSNLCSEEFRSTKRYVFRHLFSLIAVIVVCQSLLAPIYVPLVFGQSWIELGALPVIIILCLSALPRLIIEIYSQLFRAKNQLVSDLKMNLGLSIFVSVLVLIGAQYDLITISIYLTLGLSVFAATMVFIDYKLLNKQSIPNVKPTNSNYITSA